MRKVLESNESGELQIPAALLGTGPRARFRVEHDGESIRLIPEHKVPASAEQRVQAFRDWAARLPKRDGPGIPQGALRRENLYD